MNYKKKIAQAINSEIDINLETIEGFIEIPPRREMGDFALPCFKLNKIIKKEPNVIAKILKEKLEIDGFEKIESLGAYVNFFIDKSIFIKGVLEKIIEESNHYGSSNTGEGKCICIECSSPDIAKPLHVEQLSTILVGQSLGKMFEKAGYNVATLNYIKDWGIQFGKLIFAYKRWGSEEALEKNGIVELLRLYGIFRYEAQENISLEEESMLCFRGLESRDKEVQVLWNKIKKLSLKEYEEVYSVFNVKFDYQEEESFYNNKMKFVVDELREKGLVNESDGAQVIMLSEYNLPPCIVSKDDKLAIYSIIDLAAAIYRKNKYDFYKCIYVTGSQRKLHFKQVFKVLELAGHEWAKNCIHAEVGLVKFVDVNLKTGKNEGIFLNDLIKESIDKVLNSINIKKSNLKNKEEIAKKIGVGAIIFTCLKNLRKKNILFDWKEMFSVEGETYLYVQYSYAKAMSILEKGEEIKIKANFSKLNSKEAFELVKTLEKFTVIIHNAIEKLEPSIVLAYVFEVTEALNKLYNTYDILNSEDKELVKARLILIKATCQVINNALELIGVEVLEGYDVLYELTIL
ncbi:arginine--tRNA ligase [Clostridioides difficile]